LILALQAIFNTANCQKIKKALDKPILFVIHIAKPMADAAVFCIDWLLV